MEQAAAGLQKAEGSAGFLFQTAGSLAPQGGTNQPLLCLDEMKVCRFWAAHATRWATPPTINPLFLCKLLLLLHGCEL